MQQGDVNLFQTDNDGDITVEGGIVEMSGGLPVAAYLSLFGGNEDDAGGQNSPLNWWGNFDEQETAKEYRSETQNLLQALPATAANLRRVEDAATRDLSWFVSNGVAGSVSVAASMPALNKIKLVIDIDGDLTVEFIENWKVRS